jgi:4'-phosphopantetheinyl transferase EntD
VLAAEMREYGDPALLLPEERQFVAKAVLKRVGEYTAGRLCARLILRELGLSDFAIRAGEEREPIWPESVVGSITHTSGFCAAVAADQSGVRGLGLDSEIAGSVKPELFPSICTPSEIDWIATLPVTQQRDAATMLFSAKEAFYKCQFPLVRERLRFHDATIEVLKWGEDRGVLKVHTSPGIAFKKFASQVLAANYLFHQNFITVGVALTVEEVSP